MVPFKKEVRFCYRKIIGHGSAKPWDKMLFEDSYMEYRMQVQNFALHKSYPAYGELIAYMPEAKTLPARVAPSVAGYMEKLGGIVPDILNNLGRRFMQFERYDFEIINSHFEVREKHQIGISFYSVPYLWHESIGEYLIIANLNKSDVIPTETLKLQPYLSIHQLKQYE